MVGHALALVGEHLLGDGDVAEAERDAHVLAAVEQRLDVGVGLALGLRVPVALERVDEHAALLEVELGDLELAAAVEVDGALVGRVHRARDVDGADQLARGGVDDHAAVAAGRAEGDVGGGVVLGPARDVEAAGALAQRAGADEPLGGRLPGRAEVLLVGGLERALVRGAQHVLRVDLLVLVVEDRVLDRAVEELVGVAAEELVERVVARDVDGEPAAAAAGAAPLLAERGDRAGERDADRGVERADVDAELERVGGDDAEQLALDELALELAPLLGRVAGAVGRDPLGEVGVAEVLERELGELRHQLDGLARLHEHDRARALGDELGQQVGGLGEHASGACRASRR